MASEHGHRTSWRAKPIEQAPVYPDDKALADVERAARRLSAARFCRRGAQAESACSRKVAEGEAFLLQGGDCAESFAEHSRRQYPRFLPRLPADGGGADLRRGLPVVKVGRIAGQFAKPRSSPIEKRGGVDAAELSRRHHQRHRLHAGSAHARSAPPARGLSAIGGDAQSAARLRHRRLCQPSKMRISWMLGFIKDSPQSARYQDLADRITETLDFMRAMGIDPEAHPELRQTDFYTSTRRCCSATSRR